MKTNTYRVFEMDVTEEEMKPIKEFCHLLYDAMGYLDDSEEIYEIIEAITWNKSDVLKRENFKINIEEKK